MFQIPRKMERMKRRMMKKRRTFESDFYNFFKLVILTAFIIWGLYIFDFMNNMNLFASHAFSGLFNFARFSLVCSFFF